MKFTAASAEDVFLIDGATGVEAAATSVADEGSTSTTVLTLVDEAGRTLVDQNGNAIVSFAGNK
jgi:hypothetical protein